MVLILRKLMASTGLTSVACLIICATGLTAQSPAAIRGEDGKSSALRALVLESARLSVGCPVSMRALQGGMSDVIRVENGRNSGAGAKKAAPAVQRILLFLRHLDSDQAIVSAKVTVDGTSAKPRSLSAGLNDSGIADKSIMLDVRFSRDEAKEASANLLAIGFTSVSSITLRAITYSNGMTWTPTEDSFCRVVPDPMMLIAGR